jgi:exoribonuclease II
MVSNTLRAKNYLNGEREKMNKGLRWLHMTKHERKNWRESNLVIFQPYIQKRLMHQI